MMRWHYTVGIRMPGILGDGFIKPATAFVPRHERPIVWFTSALDWEETANKVWQRPNGTLVALTRETTEARAGGLFRIGVPGSIHLLRWDDVCREARMKSGDRRRLLHSARRTGSDPVNDWWGTFERVPMKEWAAVEKYSNTRWQPFDGRTILAASTAIWNEGS